MKVLFAALGVYAGVGGLERFNQRVVRSLAELNGRGGLESQVLALWDPDRDAASAPSCIRFRPGARNKPLTFARFALETAMSRPDVILYGHVLLAPMSILAHALRPRSRHILFVHGREVWREPFRTSVPLRERLPAGRAMDRIVSVSRLTAKRMSEAYGIPETRFHLLPNAVDMPPAAPVIHSRGARILTVARLGAQDRHKGCDRVIRALPRILAEVPEASYDIVGDGALRPELERLAVDTGVQGRVRFLGCIDDDELLRVYSEARLLVMPSIGEGFGIVFLEAWRHGLPVVAGNRDASAEVVTNGVNGLLVNPDSESEIAGAVIRLLKDKAAAQKMGGAGYETLLGRHTHAHFRETLWQILNC